jgi:hypothetical protein
MPTKLPYLTIEDIPENNRLVEEEEIPNRTFLCCPPIWQLTRRRVVMGIIIPR